MLKQDLYQNGLRFLTILNPSWNVKFSFKHILKNRIDLKNPKTFNEKICWLKLYDYPNNQLVIDCTDKVKVRDYVRKKGLDNILNEVYQVCDSPEEIDFEKLPDEYAIKWNNDYGSTILCKKKTEAEIEKEKRKLNKLGNRKFFLNTAELHYSKIKPKIIAEKYLNDDSQTDLYDYKVYCFNGVPSFIMVCLERQSGHARFYYYDTDWNFLRLNIDGKKAAEDFSLPKPACLAELLRAAQILSENFKFVRSDFYIVNNKPVFGELTFSPSAGLDDDLEGDLDTLLTEHLIL
ncbi:ATP-grasp fold amidoligase family protein [Liquorilactobacillus oeni]|uniref:Uncharacterized protein n=1 Tax=Liquorilactobacillus oeni DSM 19972 TaxID=1423777 RepID=A0A0R1M9F5_9LACO|nr:ATP-grasp fold amidoligase family protein [Liquorilactobacillus oeni]KRL04561.1 hypothetical protein FD46_GL001692 [Liquorilactobacillus oeni DSM 19972]